MNNLKLFIFFIVIVKFIDFIMSYGQHFSRKHASNFALLFYGKLYFIYKTEFYF